MAKRLPEEDKEKRKEEYLAIFSVFKKMIDSISADMDQWEVLEELMELRAEFAIRHAVSGFDMEYDEALGLIRNYDGELTEEEKGQKTVLVAAVDNLVDFAVAEEYQMAMELPDIDSEEWRKDFLEEICYKYNFRYSNVENLDIEYAMIVAAGLVAASSNTILTYMTQGDERVRPWHLQYEGYSATKSDFPRWLIPPIEHGCRCYLEMDEVVGKPSGVLAMKEDSLKTPEWFNPVFKESVAFGGRIFSDSHRYFDIAEEHKTKLNEISLRIKNKYLVNGE